MDNIRKKVDEPDWWYATRAMCAFVLVVAEKIGAKYIVPTDISMIHGIVKKRWSDMKNKSIAKIIFSFLILTVGCVIAAFSIGAILIPNLILDGGVNGISIMASQLTGISTSIFIIILNIPF